MRCAPMPQRAMAETAGFIVPDWDVPAAVRALVTTRRLSGHSRPPFDSCNLGAHCGDDADAVAANRAALVQTFGLPSAPRWLRQVHGSTVARFAGTEIAATEPEADAAVTAQAGVVLAVLTADCLPVLFCSADDRTIGVAHAGWRGLAEGVLERTVAALGNPTAPPRAWLGPCIGAASYEVGDEVRDAFVAHDGSSADAFAATRPGHWRCDLVRLAGRRLRRLGIVDIGGGGFDTGTDPRWYSHRRDGRSGRFASLLWIEGGAAA
jgi:YfiH family protein